jgi:sigma-B regulation protein RsbU (phosphoserine phosphatase)
MRISLKVSLLTVATAVLATTILACISYAEARREYFQGVDRQLTAAAAALPIEIGDSYLNRALTGATLDNSRIPVAEYDQMVLSLSTLADQSKVYYLYAFTRQGSEIVNVATSASAAERENHNWPALGKTYKEPSPGLLATLSDGQARFDEYSDEFGDFRSIFVRHPGPNGRPYIVGVDVSRQRIQAALRSLVYQHIAAGAIVAILAGAIGSLLANRIVHPFVKVTHEVDAWAERDFVKDDQIRSHLATLAAHNRDEAGDLASKFVEMQDRLQLFLVKLTTETSARHVMEHQLAIAHSIQESLLPQTVPKLANFDIYGWSKPADQTGGDYFDWLDMPNGSLMLTIGDVMGHGIGPALVTAASRAYARAVANPDQALNAMVTRLNDLLHTDLQGERFVTLIACMLDPDRRRMKLLAAGHGPVIKYSKANDQLEVTIDPHGAPLGMLDGAEYDQPTEILFEPGDILVLVSDGFFDWMNDKGETFGTDRLLESVLLSCRESPHQIIHRLREDIAKFNRGNNQADDTTALVIRCTA